MRSRLLQSRITKTERHEGIDKRAQTEVEIHHPSWLVALCLCTRMQVTTLNLCCANLVVLVTNPWSSTSRHPLAPDSPRLHVQPLTTAFHIALRFQILPQCLDRVRSLRLLVPTEETLCGLQRTEHRKTHPIKLDGFNQHCEPNHDWHRFPKMFQKLKPQITLLLLHLIVAPFFSEDCHILLAQPVSFLRLHNFFNRAVLCVRFTPSVITSVEDG